MIKWSINISLKTAFKVTYCDKRILSTVQIMVQTGFEFFKNFIKFTLFLLSPSPNVYVFVATLTLHWGDTLHILMLRTKGLGSFWER